MEIVMKILKSFVYAFNGFIGALIEEVSMKIHVASAVVVISLGFYFHISLTEWLILILIISMVISLELINSALERLTNLVTKEHLPLAGKAKDMAAAAVL